MLILVNNDWVNRVPKATDFPFSFRASIKKRVMKMAVKSEVAIPINRVVANPLMGPVPKTKRINAVSPVVMLASKIEESALLNPSATAFLRPLPFFELLSDPFEDQYIGINRYTDGQYNSGNSGQSQYSTQSSKDTENKEYV